MFQGPWTLKTNADSVGDELKMGEIISHRSGAIILKCPKCSSLQFVHSDVAVSHGVPTLSKRIQCGSGFCKRCAIWFGVVAGRTVIYDGPEKIVKTLIPQRLIDAGVKKAPRIDEG